MKLFALISILMVFVFAERRPVNEPILNSYGFSSMLVLNDTLRIDTTGAGAYKKVVTDTSIAHDVGYASGLVYGFRMWSNGDSITFTETMGCYSDALAAWVYSTDIDNILNYSGESPNVTYALTSTAEYGIKELLSTSCDSIKFIMSVPAAAGHSDTIYIPKRGLRIQE